MTNVTRTRRWRGIVAVALAAAALGVVSGRPSIIFLTVVGVAFAAYPELSTAPTVALELEREIDADAPDHPDDVDVAVEVTNVGADNLPDLRIVDGVPPMLPVSAGTARHATALRPGSTARFTYTIRAGEGMHRFEPAQVIARDVAGTVEVETEVTATDEESETLEQLSQVIDVPLRQQTNHFVGEITTDEGGAGIEFFQTREYQPGDALSRIDWQRYAKTGDLSTIEFREEQGASVAILVDTREPAYRTAAREQPHGVAHSHTAARQLLDALAETDHTVGLATLSDREACWLTDGAGAEHMQRARRLLVTHPSLSKTPPPESDPELWREQLTTLRGRLQSGEQVVMLTPLTDAFAVEAALTLEAAGHAVTVISPDVSTDATVGGKVARAKRNHHVHSLRGSGVRVVDWPPAEPLGAVLMRTQERWS